MNQNGTDLYRRVLYYPLIILPALVFSFAVTDVIFPLPGSGDFTEQVGTSRNIVRWASNVVVTLVLASFAHVLLRGRDLRERIVAVSYYGTALVALSILIRRFLKA